MPSSEPDPGLLELSQAQMAQVGQTVIDNILAHRTPGLDEPVSRVLSRADSDELLDEPLPRQGADPGVLLDKLQRDVFSNVSRVDHPRFFAFVPGPGNFMAAMGAALAAGHNVFSGTWLGGSAAARLEQTVIDWLSTGVGYPPEAGGLLVSGGSMANLTAIGAARQAMLGSHSAHGVVYFSSQTHSAVERALRVLGFPDWCMRRVAAHPVTGLDTTTLESLVGEDRAAGRRPFCVVGNAGTTNTGAVDPLESLADLAEQEGLWFHIDGAYGAAAVFGRRGRDRLAGLNRADSIALDPHKWLFQPFECGCVLLRDRALLRNAYAIHPEYMRDTLREDEEINFCEYGVQLSRSFRALGLWLTFKTFGADQVGQAIDHAFDLADHAAARIRGMPGWELVTEPSLAILTFRFAGAPTEALDTLNARLVTDLRESGIAMVSSTILDGRYVIRLCPINPRSTTGDVDITLNALRDMARAMVR